MRRAFSIPIFVVIALLARLVAAEEISAKSSLPDGWQTASPRAEIQPDFFWVKSDDHQAHGATLIIQHDNREGLDGYWMRSFPVRGGEFYQFHAARRLASVNNPRRSCLIRLVWLNDRNERISDDRPVVSRYHDGAPPAAEVEHPADGQTSSDGWTEISETYQTPQKATQARVELHLMWAQRGRVEWRDVSFDNSEPPAPRKVRLATIHLRPDGKTAETNCRRFAPLIEEAAAKKADLIVLPETLTYFGTGKTPADVAESIPGPSTDYFGTLALKHNLYLVVGLYERADNLVYNVAVLIGPDGKVAGKYRKVTLPTGEIEQGVAAGHEYPVFKTRFGTLGMMICYDGFFPEVARELSNRGAEVIAWPVWGCHPDLAKARAMENHVYLVSSTYEDVSRNWMISAVFDRTGQVLSQASKWGTISISEVDLNQHTRWRSLGDFKARITRHRP